MDHDRLHDHELGVGVVGVEHHHTLLDAEFGLGARGVGLRDGPSGGPRRRASSRDAG